MKLLMTGCMHCGTYTSSVDGICDGCRAARDSAHGVRAVGQRERRVRVRKRAS